jgi:hypothetical protein
MNLQPTPIPSNDSDIREFAEPMERQPLEVVMDAPDSQSTTVDLDVAEDAWLPVPVAEIDPESVPATLKDRKDRLFDFYAALSKIDRQSISDAELQPARIYIGLMFVGFSALSLMLVLLHSHTMYSGLTSVQQIQRYWEPYVTFVCMGVAGMMMLGREAMRPQVNHSVNRNRQR